MLTETAKPAKPKFATTQRLKVAILGTRGIPNHYGGFEQFAEQFSVRLTEKGHEVFVYSSHNHPYQEAIFNGVQLIHCHDLEHKMGTAGQFVYDLNCILDSRKRNFDIILQLGYTSSTVWSWLFPKDALIVTNMDGLEWSRAKYAKPVQQFLKKAEQWGVQYSDFLIADSPGIQEYLQQKYKAKSVFIPYGAELYEPEEEAANALTKFNLTPYQYDLLIARFEPENNIETVLKAYAKDGNRKLVLIGNHQATKFGQYCYKNYNSCSNVSFLGPVYDITTLNALRYYSALYLHGHSVGGTNPSLLEAMASNALVAAHNNIFNRAVLGEDAFYFTNEHDLLKLLQSFSGKPDYQNWLINNRRKIQELYNWDTITNNIEQHFLQWMKAEK